MTPLSVLLAAERVMLLGWQEALTVCKRGGDFQVEGYEKERLTRANLGDNSRPDDRGIRTCILY